MLKLNDAITRNKIRKTERDCEELKDEQSKLQKVIAKVEKQHNTDQQYLIKQKELQARYELDLALMQVKKQSASTYSQSDCSNSVNDNGNK